MCKEKVSTSYANKVFKGVSNTFGDPRANLLKYTSSEGNSGQANVFSSGLPPELTKAIHGGAFVSKTVLLSLTKQLFKLLLTWLEKLKIAELLAGFGMDRMPLRGCPWGYAGSSRSTWHLRGSEELLWL